MPVSPLLIAATIAVGSSDPVIVTSDNTTISSSCTIRIDAPVLEDTDGNGVIHIEGNDLIINFDDGAKLIGAAALTPPDQMHGIGVVLRGRNIEIRNLHASGFKVGLLAIECDGLIVDGCTFDNNFRQRLLSTTEGEDNADWLFPHQNDEQQWRTQHGAAVCVENSNDVSLSHIVVRNTQNGIVLDRVNGSRVFDCDCSFLSGWGLALWRSSRNVVSRNAFDFCIRGYSDGIYNRGQDSAGILMFEQCDENIIAENSATHGGDGFFAFAGREALGEGIEHDDLEWYADRGHTNNLIVNNDFSYAAAHGLELTFSFDNRIYGNRFVENAICGIWGGYSQRFHIANNHFQQNGELGYGAERGGINIEHGAGTVIERNTFNKNRCAIRLWTDADEGLMALPWCQVNENGSRDNMIVSNRFTRDEIALELLLTNQTYLTANTMRGVKTSIESDSISDFTTVPPRQIAPFQMPTYAVFGDSTPFGARNHLAGRHNIVMTPWGPWDHASPVINRVADATAASHVHHYAIRCQTDEAITSCTWRGGPNASQLGVRWSAKSADGLHLSVEAPDETGAFPYHYDIVVGEKTLEVKGVIINAEWTVRMFEWSADPRENVNGWEDGAFQNELVRTTLPSLKLDFKHEGPHALGIEGVDASHIPNDAFGTIAMTTLPVAAGRWRIVAKSDDGIRVKLNRDLVINDWTWHAPKDYAYEFVVEEDAQIDLLVEHFELDGYAVLHVALEYVGEE